MISLTYNRIRNIMRKVLPVLAVLFLLLPGCSYVMDAIEGAITERASFSIDAEYSGGVVNISWSETGSSDFAGYEIYITDEADNEYAGYDIIASYYYGTPTVGLSANSYSFNPGTRHGVYFFRLGIIMWDESNESKRDSNYIGTTSWDIEPNREANYNIHTEIDKISGAARVVIP